MTPRAGDKQFRHPGVSRLDYKQMEMDRVLTAFLARLRWNGSPSVLARSADLTAGDLVEIMRKHPELFSGLDDDTTRRWVETHLLDVVNRGRPNQMVAGLRPLHGFTYRLRNARRSRSYGADEQLYETIRYAADGRGDDALAYLREFFFAGVDQNTERLRPEAQIDVETQALINLWEAVKGDVADRPAKEKERASYPPLYQEAADVLVNDIVRLLLHEDFVPRSVLVDYLKILFAFHLALYHLRILTLLPARVAGRRAAADGGFFVDVAGIPGTPAARLAEYSASVWYGRIPEFVRATFMVKKLDEFADHLVRRGKLRRPGGGHQIDDLLALLGAAHKKDRTAFAAARLSRMLEASDGAGTESDLEIEQILQLGLDDFTTYIEIITAYRVGFHRKYLTECLDSLLLKNRPGAMLAQPRRGGRRFVLDSRLLEVLLQIALLREGGRRGFHTAALRVDEFLEILRNRYGLHIDRLPRDGFDRPTITDQAALRSNAAAFTSRLREIGFYSDLSDAYLTQTITPRYTIPA
jgi:hypothetical protein